MSLDISFFKYFYCKEETQDVIIMPLLHVSSN